jgi:drug/metabolite transporter (DMT)-like permease
VPATALILALAGAFVHAAWNLALAGEPDVHAATAAAVVAGVVLLAPVALADWRLEADAWPYVAASAALELLYLALLATAYARAAAGFVYPTARGAAPVFVLLIGVLALGQVVSGLAAAGVAAIAAGIVLVRGPSGPRGAADLALALAIGGCIAGYTLVDQKGVGHASTPTYLLLVFVFAGAGYVAGAWRARGAAALRAAVSVRTVLAGAGFFVAYGLTLAALKEAPAAAVAAVRETSVVIAVAWLALSGRERVTGRRAAGAVAVACGVALISAGGGGG